VYRCADSAEFKECKGGGRTEREDADVEAAVSDEVAEEDSRRKNFTATTHTPRYAAAYAAAYAATGYAAANTAAGYTAGHTDF
jgi:hypothetical protein